MNRRVTLAVAGWVVAAVATTALATGAVDALASGLLGSADRPLSAADVQRELADGASSTAQSPTAGPSGSPASPQGDARVLATTGGTVLARCDGAQVTLVSWSPAQGYRADDVSAGPAPAALVTFKADRTELRVTVTCVSGVPTATTATDDHH